MNDNSWLDIFTLWVDRIDGIVWGVPLILSVLLTGLILTVSLGGLHLVRLREAFRLMFHKEDGAVGGEVSHFESLCTALSATIGTGNIVGVATAITTGGPGALFWMEVAALLGMATKYAEGLLAVKYRKVLSDGTVIGGPFRYIECGLKGRLGITNWRWLAVMFAVFGTLAGIMGIGTVTQIHGIASAVQTFFDPSFDPEVASSGVRFLGGVYSKATVIAGLVVTVSVALVVIGGIKRIAKVSTVVVPFMAISYVFAIILILIVRLPVLGETLSLIVKSAFNPEAVTGGAVGSVFVVIQMGVARGIFSNEAGLGSAPIAAAAAKTNEPARQGLVCMTGTFIDTIVICTMTGLVIVSTGAWDPQIGLKGVNVTIEAFTRGLSFLGGAAPSVASFFLMASLTFFAFTTILGWSYYSGKCFEYLVGSGRPWAVKIFQFLYVGVVFIGPYLTVSAVWGLADIFNGLMALPNLVALVLLSPVVVKTTREYIGRTSGSIV